MVIRCAIDLEGVKMLYGLLSESPGLFTFLESPTPVSDEQLKKLREGIPEFQGEGRPFTVKIQIQNYVFIDRVLEVISALGLYPRLSSGCATFERMGMAIKMITETEFLPDLMAFRDIIRAAQDATGWKNEERIMTELRRLPGFDEVWETKYQISNSPAAFHVPATPEQYQKIMMSFLTVLIRALVEAKILSFPLDAD